MADTWSVVPGGTTGDVINSKVKFYDSPGGEALGVLKYENYGVVIEALVDGVSWFGIIAGAGVRFVKASDLKNVKVTRLDYNTVVEQMVMDIFGKTNELMEKGDA